MKIFITGIAGFLGSRLAKHFIEKGHTVSGCDTLIGGYLENIPEDAEFHQVDCQYLNAMKKLIAGHDVVIHTACTAYEGMSVFSPHLVTQNTLQISTSVFTACAANKIPRVINCSSMARYGVQDHFPFDESMRPNPVDPYGVAKVAAEQVLSILAEVHGFEYVNFVPHNIIGAHQKYDDPFRNVASIMINQMLRQKQPIIYGDGLQRRCFTDVRDIIPCFEKALTSQSVVGQTINIGPDEDSITIRDLAFLIADTVGFTRLDPLYVDPRPCEVKNATCNATKSRELLGYKTNFALKDTILDMVHWIKQKGPKKFRYHLALEVINDKTPKPWKDKLFT